MSNQHYPKKIANYWVGETLGSGFSGSIFRATHLYSKHEVALKLQRTDVECPTNRYERYFYPMLQGGQGMPTLWAAGIEGKYDYLAIDLLGPSLDSLFRKSGRDVMDLRSVCCIAMQVISRLEFMHARGVLHRDIQLGNCVIGLPPDEQVIYMIDFGFSKFYIDPTTGRHIPDEKHDFIGNYWFTSVAVHCKSHVPSRRDDLEAVALMLIHLLTPGGLSWTRNGVPKTDAAHERLKREKRHARPEDLCRGLPSEFEEFLRYCRRLKFTECPDYAHWVNEFRELMKDMGYPSSSRFVWPPPELQTIRVLSPQKRSSPANADAVEGVLNDLANLRLGDRQVLGTRNEIVNGVRAQAGGARKPAVPPANVVVISVDDENPPRNKPVAMRTKAMLLAKLARAVPDATGNIALADVITEFVGVLQESRSKTLTKDGFAFLDALYKQLADPSVYVQPMRTSHPRTNSKEGEQAPAVDLRYTKLNKLWNLRRDVSGASSNKALAQMVAEFGSVINRSNGRTVTKDAFGFLDGLAERLRTIA